MTLLTATDAELSRAIRRALDRSPDVDGYDIHVRVDAGRVLLTGAVGSFAERLSARSLAAAFVGPDALMVAVRVRATADLSPASDRALLAAGHAALRAGPSSLSDRVTLTVEQRVATLTGHVDTFAERRAARHALESVTGVNFVHNLLTVDEEIAGIRALA